ncbi:MAG TPA: DUF1707 domain-containing protein [Trebonia sp.]|nr:DUF1707 domain-containing protein [Trebonia sp.]
MSPTSSQWTRRIRYSDQHIRVSDAERNQVAELLGQHYADGRLDQAEFDDRVSRTMAAKTRGDLVGLFDDLPDADSTAGAGSTGPGGPAGPALPYRARRRGGVGRALLLLVLILIGANIAWHAFASLFFIGPLVWLFVLVAVVLLVTRAAHRHDR